MTLKQAQKFLDKLKAEEYCKYAKTWSENMWRMPTEIIFAEFIKNYLIK